MSQKANVSSEDLYRLHIIEGKSLNQIEKILGVSRPTLKKNLIKYGIEHHKTNAPIAMPPKEDLISLHHNQEKQLKEIAGIYNVPQGKITQWFKEYGIEVIDRQKIPVPPRNELEKLYNSGLTFVELGKRYNTSNVTVRKWFYDYGIEVRSHSQTIKDTSTSRKTNDCYSTEISNKNIITLEPYKNSRTRIKHKCLVCNSEWYRKPSVVLRYEEVSCPKCAIKASHDKQRRTHDEYVQLVKEKHGDDIIVIENYINNYEPIKHRHTCGYEWKTRPYTVLTGKHGCPKCAFLISDKEEEVREYLNSFGHDFITTRKVLDGKELDGYDSTIQIAFEYCGLYWHNEQSPSPRNKEYHYKKFEMCRDKGIRLVTIFDDEWVYRKEQVKGFLQSVIGKPDRIHYARKCKICVLPYETARDFLDLYHIQGSPAWIQYAYGILSNGELLGVMSFAKHHRKIKDLDEVIVLNRLAFAKGVLVIGGASKLLKYGLNNELQTFDKVISWSDNRWTWGNVYQKLGFEKEEELSPDYSYVELGNPKIRHSKQSKQKRLIDCAPGQTEKERCEELGLARIWDCGKIRWGLKIKKEPE